MFYARFSCCAALIVATLLCLVPTLRAQSSLPISSNRAAPNPVERALASRVTLQLPEQPLNELAAFLRAEFQLNVVIDRAALDDVGLDTDTQLAAMDVQQVELETVVSLLLDQVDLCFMLRDQIVVITTPEEAENHLSTHVYLIADLLGLTRSFIPGDATLYPDYDTLISTLTSSVAPDTWDEVGGAGSIEPFPPSQSLVISQTRPVHKKIEALLETLRKAKSMQPAPPVNVRGKVPGSMPGNVGSVPHRPGGGIPAGGRLFGSPPPVNQGGFF